MGKVGDMGSNRGRAMVVDYGVVASLWAGRGGWGGVGAKSSSSGPMFWADLL